MTPVPAVSLMPIDPLGPSQAGLAAQALTSLTLIQSIGITNLSGLNPAEILRSALTPLHADPELVARLTLSDAVCRDLSSFLRGDHTEPSASLLEALHGSGPVLKTILFDLSPHWFAAPESVTATGKIDQKALEEPEMSEEAMAQHDAQIREAVNRLLEGIHERARTSLVATPKAISLKDVLDHPENYRDKPLEIALFDVDGTTHKGEAFFEGQYSVEWLLRDVLRYGPKATAGLSWWRLLKAIPGIIALRWQERKHGHADREKFNQTFGPLLKGLDARLAKESLNRFYNKYGSRGVSEFMKTEFIRHRQKDRLIIGISASLEHLVKRHAKDLGVPQENMLGTMIEVDEQDKATGTFRWIHGEEKVRALEEFVLGPLREKGISYKLVAGYSDSPSDRPMLDLVKRDGGIKYATNSSKETFKEEVLADGGVIVDEEDRWLSNGERLLTFATSQSGQLQHREETSPKRPAWIADLGHYTSRVLTDAAGFAMAGPASEATRQALNNGGHVNVSWDLLASAPTLAATGFIASALTTFLVPPDGPVSWQRRVLWRGMIPVASAMAATGSTGGLSFWGTMGMALVASGGVELLTAGERSAGLRKWRGGEERKNPVGRAFGFGALRSLQLSAFRVLTFLLKGFLGA
jgi:phosphoserine phosphatase